jgi:hypothetical protein
MRWIANFERTMERWTGTALSLVRKPKEKPAEVVAVLRQECDDNALIVGRGRTLVPNHFTIELPRDSHRQLDAHSGQLTPHLAAQIRRYAAEQRYSFAGPVTIRLRAHPENDRVRYRVHSHIAPHHAPAPSDDLTKALPMPVVTGEGSKPTQAQD